MKGASRGLEGGLRRASRGLQGGLRRASRGLEKGFKGASRGLQALLTFVPPPCDLFLFYVSTQCFHAC